jgi:hypothetical protein
MVGASPRRDGFSRTTSNVASLSLFIFAMPMNISTVVIAAALAASPASHGAASELPKTTKLQLADCVLSVSQPHSRTWLRLRRGGARAVQVALPADATIDPRTLERVRLVAQPDGATALVETTYSSQTGVGGPNVQCAAGEETVLRIIQVRPFLRQSATLLTQSCWKDVYLGLANWDAGTRTIHMSDDDSTVFKITADGRFIAASSRPR